MNYGNSRIKIWIDQIAAPQFDPRKKELYESLRLYTDWIIWDSELAISEREEGEVRGWIALFP